MCKEKIYEVYPEVEHPGVVDLDAHYTMIVKSQKKTDIEADDIRFSANNSAVKFNGNILTVPYHVRNDNEILTVTVTDADGNYGEYSFDFIKFSDEPTLYDDFDCDTGLWEPDWYEGGKERGRLENSNIVFTTSPDGPRSSVMGTHKSFSQAYGCFSASMKCPPKGCVNCAFWLCTYGNFKPNPDFPGVIENDITGGEIDVTELWPASQKYGQTVHWFGWNEHHKESTQQIPLDFDWSEYHTYTVVWTKDAYYWYTDDRLVRKYDGEGVAPDSDPMIVLIHFNGIYHDNSESWLVDMCGKYDADELPQEVRFDWVKVHSIK